MEDKERDLFRLQHILQSTEKIEYSYLENTNSGNYCPPVLMVFYGCFFSVLLSFVEYKIEREEITHTAHNYYSPY